MRSRVAFLAAVLLALAAAVPALAGPRKERVFLRSHVEIAYTVDGPRDGHPILFIHSVSDTSFAWSEVVPELADTYRVYALDLRGHGDSEKPQYGYSIQQFSEDVVAFMQRLRMREAVLVGHGLGGLVAQRVAAFYPQRVSHLVLIGSAATAVGNPLLTRIWDEIVNQPDFRDPLPEGFFDDWQGGPGAVDPEFFERVVAEGARTPARVWRGAYASLLTDDTRAFLDQVTAPTLILWGSRDAIYPAPVQDGLRAALPHAELIAYRGARHNVHWEEPRRVAGDVRTLIESNGSGPAP